jgi:probable HAF family extracellular repeat protein
VTRHGEVTELGKLGGPDTDAVATAINENGWVVGYSSKTPYGENYAFIHDGSGMRELDASGHPGRAYDVNDLGDAVGDDDGGRPLLFRDGAAIDLGTVTEGATAHATSINRHGDIVGCEKQADRRRQMAVIWPGGKGPRRLTGLLDPVSGAGWELGCATSINKAGQITGWGRHDGVWRIFLLTPMP